jgi:hypothetical protein
LCQFAFSGRIELDAAKYLFVVLDASAPKLSVTFKKGPWEEGIRFRVLWLPEHPVPPLQGTASNIKLSHV